MRDTVDGAAGTDRILTYELRTTRRRQRSFDRRRFGAQLDELLSGDEQLVRLSSLVSSRGLRPRIALVFATADACVFTDVVPELARRALPATIFVTTGYVGHPGGRVAPGRPHLPPMMSWGQLATLPEEIDIGSAAHTGRALTGLPPEEATWEVTHSRQVLQRRAGAAATSFVYPDSDHDELVRAVVAGAGYRVALAGPHGRAGDRWRLPTAKVDVSTPTAVLRRTVARSASPGAVS